MDVVQDSRSPLTLIHKIQGYVLPGHCPKNFKLVEVYSNTYRFWRGVYSEVYSQTRSLESLNTDNFYRQDEIFSLVIEQQVIGCILFSYHNTLAESAWDLKYFHDLPREMVDQIRAHAPRSLMMMESLTVHPEWRRSRSGLPLAEILLGMAMKAFKASQCEVLVGTPRVDVKVHKLCALYGGKCLGSIAKSGYSCETFLFAGDESHTNPNPDVAVQIETLWNQRIETLKIAEAA